MKSDVLLLLLLGTCVYGQDRAQKEEGPIKISPALKTAFLVSIGILSAVILLAIYICIQKRINKSTDKEKREIFDDWRISSSPPASFEDSTKAGEGTIQNTPIRSDESTSYYEEIPDVGETVDERPTHYYVAIS